MSSDSSAEPDSRKNSLSNDSSRPSKTQRKHEMHALQALGEKIIALSESLRSRLPLSDELVFGIEETARIRSHEGRRRHMQYIGKLMRHEDLDAIQAVFDEIAQDGQRRDHAFYRLERWRDRLIEEGDPAVEAFIVDYPQVDRQALRQLIRNVKQEREQDKPPTNARRLFKLLRDTAEL